MTLAYKITAEEKEQALEQIRALREKLERERQEGGDSESAPAKEPVHQDSPQ